MKGKPSTASVAFSITAIYDWQTHVTEGISNSLIAARTTPALAHNIFICSMVTEEAKFGAQALHLFEQVEHGFKQG